MSTRDLAPREPRRESARRRILAEFVDELLPLLEQPDGVSRKMWRHSVTWKLSSAVEAGLSALRALDPPPPAVELASALDAINRERGRSWHISGLEATTYDEVVEKLPRDVRRALLASFHPEHGRRLGNHLRETWKELLFPWLDYWFDEIQAERDREEAELWGYGAAYPSAGEASKTERHLEAVAADTKRTKAERIDAASQLGKLEQARLRRREISTEPSTLSAIRDARAGTEDVGAPDRGSTEKRFAELTDAAGWADAAAFGALAKRGRPSATESERLRRLGQAAKTLHDEGHTLERIGAVMGGRDRQRVFDLIARTPKSGLPVY